MLVLGNAEGPPFDRAWEPGPSFSRGGSHGTVRPGMEPRPAS
jgi:hypothetical protein